MVGKQFKGQLYSEWTSESDPVSRNEKFMNFFHRVINDRPGKYAKKLDVSDLKPLVKEFDVSTQNQIYNLVKEVHQTTQTNRLADSQSFNTMFTSLISMLIDSSQLLTSSKLNDQIYQAMIHRLVPSIQNTNDLPLNSLFKDIKIDLDNAVWLYYIHFIKKFDHLNQASDFVLRFINIIEADSSWAGSLCKQRLEAFLNSTFFVNKPAVVDQPEVHIDHHMLGIPEFQFMPKA